MQRTNSTVVVTSMFREHPLGFPLGLIITGAFLLTVVKLNIDLNSGIMFFGAMGLGLAMLCFGALMLPFGVVTAARRKFRKVALVCPACGFSTANSSARFVIERPGHLNYAVVTCPKCSWVFEAEKYATLA